MGGAKKKGPSGIAKKENKYKIPSSFDCPVCDAKGAIQIRFKRAESVATVHCLSCKFPEPPFKCHLPKGSKAHLAYYEYYDYLQERDEAATARQRVTTLHPTSAMRADGAAAGGAGAGGDAAGTDAAAAKGGFAAAVTAAAREVAADETRDAADDEVDALLNL